MLLQTSSDRSTESEKFSQQFSSDIVLLNACSTEKAKRIIAFSKDTQCLKFMILNESLEMFESSREFLSSKCRFPKTEQRLQLTLAFDSKVQCCEIR